MCDGYTPQYTAVYRESVQGPQCSSNRWGDPRFGRKHHASMVKNTYYLVRAPHISLSAAAAVPQQQYTKICVVCFSQTHLTAEHISHTHTPHHHTIMRKRGADLPMSSGGRCPTPPRRQLTMPDATPANVFSSIWVVSSLVVIAMGYLHCSFHMEQSRLYCTEDVCRFSRDSPDSRR